MYWVTGILGLLLAVAPFALGYREHPGAMWTSVVLGVIVLLASLYEAIDKEKAKWEYWVAGVAGLLAIIAPFALGFSAMTSALWTTVILGAILLILAGYELFYVERSQKHQS
ncbi:SPW repeat protein [Litorilinea aerophila]|uniref:SPW repeat-containing integral membrane domain-containing protein n=1 Tax=Litorilinea aerophila TaxID=1204385 RepID=A0A540VDY2_9CHLR|nr:SPW repeat protein [Litorilinea aerophila]MCC9077415.1 SPW repeat protein [Litorilinea aerophila]GIV76287.1 MAG: hypothetical protein KatS3mg050_0681 [Litorilinea sp.]